MFCIISLIFSLFTFLYASALKKSIVSEKEGESGKENSLGKVSEESALTKVTSALPSFLGVTRQLPIPTKAPG